MWQPIDTAPKDVVVLTDEGTAIKTVPAGYGFYHDVPKAHWYLCDAGGNIPSCADEGVGKVHLVPRFWMPFPEVPRGE